VNALVNMSQMTVSEMSIQNTTPSHQQRQQHWLSERALAWSGPPVVTIRATRFLESCLQLAAPSAATQPFSAAPAIRVRTVSNNRSGWKHWSRF
jgi:hypothetical protein